MITVLLDCNLGSLLPDSADSGSFVPPVFPDLQERGMTCPGSDCASSNMFNRIRP